MKVGRRLAIKILNASRFVLSRLDGSETSAMPATGFQALDAAMLARLAAVVERGDRRVRRLRPRHGPSRSPSRSSGRTATTTSSS